MPTKKPRIYTVPDNLPSVLKEEEFCPALHTGQRLAEKDPARYAKVVQMMVEGESIKRIMKVCKVGSNTLAAIRSREKGLVDECKKNLRGLIGVAAQSAVEDLIDKIAEDKIPAGVVPIAAGIMIDKSRTADGEPTQTIEVKKTLTLDEVKAELDNLRSGAVEAEVVDSQE